MSMEKDHLSKAGLTRTTKEINLEHGKQENFEPEQIEKKESVTPEDFQEYMGLIMDVAKEFSDSAILIVDGVPVLFEDGKVKPSISLALQGQEDENKMMRMVSFFLENPVFAPYIHRYAVEKMQKQQGIINPGLKLHS